MTQLNVGARYRLKRDVERYPHFIAQAGLEGVIDSDDGDAVYLKMDVVVEGAEAWDNCVQWVRHDGDDPLDDLEPLSLSDEERAHFEGAVFQRRSSDENGS